MIFLGESTVCKLGALQNLVAFHPRPQIASDLGRNATRNFNPHRNRNQFPSGNEILAYGRRLKSQPASTRCDLRNRKPNPPLFTGDLNSSNRKPAGRNRRIRAARRPQIAESPATRPLSCKRRGSEQSTFLAIFWGLLVFSGSPVL